MINSGLVPVGRRHCTVRVLVGGTDAVAGREHDLGLVVVGSSRHHEVHDLRRDPRDGHGHDHRRRHAGRWRPHDCLPTAGFRPNGRSGPSPMTGTLLVGPQRLIYATDLKAPRPSSNAPDRVGRDDRGRPRSRLLPARPASMGHAQRRPDSRGGTPSWSMTIRHHRHSDSTR